MLLSIGEINAICDELRRLAKRSQNSRVNLALFRLSTCLGLRVFETVALDRDDVQLDSDRPHVFVRCGKGGKSGRVPAWWDAQTLSDLREFKASHQNESFLHRHDGGRMSKRNAQARYKTCLRILGKEREKQLSIHKGRHAFITHAINAGKSIACVRDAARHSNIATTSRYAHAIDDGKVGNIFAF